MAKNKEATRRAKLAQKAKQRSEFEVTAYSKKTYRSDYWQPYANSVDMATYDAILYSGQHLTNSTVKHALETLVRRLRKGHAPTLIDGEIEIGYSSENEVEYLIQGIRRKWTFAFENLGPRKVEDLIGVLRTLLFSVMAHGANTGSTRGYVDFIWHFIGSTAEPGQPAPINWVITDQTTLLSDLKEYDDEGDDFVEEEGDEENEKPLNDRPKPGHEFR